MESWPGCPNSSDFIAHDLSPIFAKLDTKNIKEKYCELCSAGLLVCERETLSTQIPWLNVIGVIGVDVAYMHRRILCVFIGKLKVMS